MWRISTTPQPEASYCIPLLYRSTLYSLQAKAQRERGSQADGRAFLPFLSRTTLARGGGGRLVWTLIAMKQKQKQKKEGLRLRLRWPETAAVDRGYFTTCTLWACCTRTGITKEVGNSATIIFSFTAHSLAT
jgi:hypothetical protein